MCRWGDGTDGVECAGGRMGLMVWSVQVGGGTDGLPCFTDTERCD